MVDAVCCTAPLGVIISLSLSFAEKYCICVMYYNRYFFSVILYSILAHHSNNLMRFAEIVRNPPVILPSNGQMKDCM